MGQCFNCFCCCFCICNLECTYTPYKEGKCVAGWTWYEILSQLSYICPTPIAQRSRRTNPLWMKPWVRWGWSKALGKQVGQFAIALIGLKKPARFEEACKGPDMSVNLHLCWKANSYFWTKSANDDLFLSGQSATCSWAGTFGGLCSWKLELKQLLNYKLGARDC